MTEGALFAGIMGFGEGFRRAGFENLWAVEKEPFCRAVIRSRFPETELFEDVRECGKSNLRAVDVLTAGFPCQDLSVAGKRAGLAGARSGLFWEVVRILGELRPPWFVLENVPGLFSSNNGEDFRVVLESLDELGYGLAWRVLDSQFFGVAQRRRRVFIVGCFGKPCPAQVLFESEGGEGDFAESRETRKELATEIAASLRGAGGGPRGFMCDAEAGLAVTLSAANHDKSHAAGRRREDDINLAYCLREDPGGTGQGHNTTYAITENMRNRSQGPANYVAHQISSSAGHHGHSSPRGDGSDNLVLNHADEQRDGLQSIRGESGATSHGSGAESRESGRGRDRDIVGQAISSKWSKGTSGPAGDEHHNLIAIQDVRGHRDKKQNGIGIDASGGAMYTLDGTSQHAVGGYLEHKQRTRELGRDSGRNDEHNGGTDDECAEIDAQRMRDAARLPLGMDSARYRALGNAVTAKVSYWIARRILEHAEP